MTDTLTSLPGGTWSPGDDLTLTRVGYGAMQLAGPGVMGPPPDRAEAVAVLRDAVELGITHVDTSAAYGPHVTNEIVREALAPYGDAVHVATKVGADRDGTGGWPTARTRADLVRQVHENITTLGVERLDLVNLRMGDATGPRQEPLGDALAVLVDLQRGGLVRHLGLSNVTREQVEEARSMASVVCVQNRYNLAHREDDALVDELAAEGIAYVPYFPLGGFSPVQSAALGAVAARLGSSPVAVSLAWLLQRSPTILLIPGTSSRAHLRDNVTGAGLVLSPEDVRALDAVAGDGR